MNIGYLFPLLLLCFTTAFGQTHQFIPINSAESLKKSALRSSFDKQIENKRVVFLGDIVHGEANLDSARAYIMDYLIDNHGFNAIAFESGIYNLHIANQHFKNGADVRETLSESIFGVWSGSSLQPLTKVIEKHRNKVDLIGFDLQYSGNNTYDIDENLINYLSSIDVDPEYEIIENWVEICANVVDFNVKNIDTAFFKKTFNGIHNSFEQANASHKSTSQYKTWMQILHSTKVLYYWLKNEGIADKTNEDFKAHDSNTRDEMMAANLKFYLDLFPGMKVICWGASAHFARNTSTLINDELNGFKPMGTYFGDEAIVIGAIGFTGKFGWTGNVHDMPTLPNNSIEYKLSKLINNIALVDLQHWKSSMPLYSSAFVEGPLVKGDWSEVFDWVIFMNKVIPKTYAGEMNSANNENDSSSYTESPGLNDRTQILLLKGEGIPLKGKIVTKSGSPIPFSSIALKGTSIGTVANEHGEFLIKVPAIDDVVLVFSNVSYEEKELSALELKKGRPVVLEEKLVMLPEVIVSNGKNNAQDILSEAIDRIEENYSQGPISRLVLHRGLYSDSLSGKVTSVDWVAESYFEEGYSSRPAASSLQMLNARIGVEKNANQIEYKTYQTSMWDILGMDLLDQVMYRKRSYLNKRNHKYFDFELEDIFVDGDEMFFKIAFVCNKINSKTATYSVGNPIRYHGSILINSSDYAVIKTESVLVHDVKNLSKAQKRLFEMEEGTYLLKVSASYAKQGANYTLESSSQYSNFDKKGYRNYYYFDITKDIENVQIPGNTYKVGTEEYDESYWHDIINRLNEVGNK